MKTNKELLLLLRQVCHDIRSPLKALEIVTEEFAGGKQTIAKGALQRLRSIFDDLSLKEGEVVLCFIADVMNGLIAEKKTLYHGLDIEFHGMNLPIRVNRCAFERVFSNLIDNSIKSELQRGVTISLARESRRIKIVVQDDGQGIEGEKLKQLRLGKTGMGLAHARAFVEKLDGRFDIFSAKGRGTRILLEFPEHALLAKYRIVHLDNDKYLRMAWSMRARGKGIPLLSVGSYPELASELENIDSGATIYIDYDLEEDKTGLAVAEALYRQGFKNLYISSGYNPSCLPRSTVIKGFLDKDVPF